MLTDRTDRSDAERIIAGVTSAHRRLSNALRTWATESSATESSETGSLETDRADSATIVAVIGPLVDEGGSMPDPVDPFDLVEVVDRSNRSLETAWHNLDAPTVRLRAYRRWRAVEIAHLELGRTVPAIAYGFGDLPDEFVRRELRELEMLWCARRPIGLAGLPPAVTTLTPIDRLGWLLGLVEVPGLPPAGLIGIIG